MNSVNIGPFKATASKDLTVTTEAKIPMEFSRRPRSMSIVPNLAKSWTTGSQCNHQHIAVPKFKAKWYKVSHLCILLITQYWPTSGIITYLLLFCCNLTSCKKEQELTLPVRVRRAQVGFSTSVLPQVPIGASLSEKEHRGSRSKSLGVGSNFER